MELKHSERIGEIIGIIGNFQNLPPGIMSDFKSSLAPKLQQLAESLGEITPWFDLGNFAFAREHLEYCHKLVTNLDELKQKYPNMRALIGNIKVSINKKLEPLIHDTETRMTYTAEQLKDFKTKELALKEEQQTIKDSQLDALLVETLKSIPTLVDEKMRNQRVFFCYAWPTPENKEKESWVQPFLKNLYRHLKSAGLKPIMDLLDNVAGGNINTFMKQAHLSEYVLVFCTPSLFHKHDDPAWSAIKTELSHIDSKRDLDLHTEQTRVIPIQLSGTQINSFPQKYKLNSTVRDWRDNGYVKSLEQLIGQVYFGAESMTPSEYTTCWQTFHDMADAKKQQNNTSVRFIN